MKDDNAKTYVDFLKGLFRFNKDNISHRGYLYVALLSCDQ